MRLASGARGCSLSVHHAARAATLRFVSLASNALRLALAARLTCFARAAFILWLRPACIANGPTTALARRSTALARLATFGRLASPRPVRAPSFAACQAARCAVASYRFRNGRGERALALCRDLPSFPGARFVGRQRFYALLSGQASSPRAWCAQAALAAFPSRRAASHVRNSPEGFAGRALSASAEKGGR
ncbi:hypothetical protein ERJ75_000608100 [Trypanosoma vivax]|nr:hypothetical protein ERJ75_000608100 [Trypanosoma vivax]